MGRVLIPRVIFWLYAAKRVRMTSTLHELCRVTRIISFNINEMGQWQGGKVEGFYAIKPLFTNRQQ